MPVFWKIFCVLFIFSCFEVFVSCMYEPRFAAYAGGSLQTQRKSIIHFLGTHKVVMDASGEAYEVFGIRTEEDFGVLRVASPKLILKNPNELSGKKFYNNALLIPPIENASQFPPVVCDAVVYPQTKMDIAGFGSDPETGLGDGKIVNMNNQKIATLEEHRGSTIRAEVFKGRYNKQTVLIYVEVAGFYGPYLRSNKLGEVVISDVKLQKTGKSDVRCNVLISPIIAEPPQNPKKFVGGSLTTVYGRPLCTISKHRLSTAALEFYEATINGHVVILKVESLSADIQTLKKDSLSATRPSAGRFYSSVYLFTKSATEKVVCNAFMVLKENLSPTISSKSGSILRNPLLSSSSGASIRSMTGRSSASGSTILAGIASATAAAGAISAPTATGRLSGPASSSRSGATIAAGIASATKVGSAFPAPAATPATNIAAPRNYQEYSGGSVLTEFSDVVVEDLRYTSSVGQLEFFQAYYNGSNSLVKIAFTDEAKQVLQREATIGKQGKQGTDHLQGVFLWPAPYIGELTEVPCDVLIEAMPDRQKRKAPNTPNN